ncbi:MAG: hypothetical protein IJ880_01270 [Bacilli bacterium]|nr:hypothetical protein [Bacilli bacterium]
MNNELKEALEEFMSSYYADITHSQYELICNHINNLQSKIDKATKKADELRKYIYSELVDFNVCGSTEAHCLAKDILDILKEDK